MEEIAFTFCVSRLLIILFYTAQKMNFCSNPFVPNAPFLYPLKASENRKVFWCFQGVQKGFIGKHGVRIFSLNVPRCFQEVEKGSIENKWVRISSLNLSRCFQGVEKGCIGNKWVGDLFTECVQQCNTLNNFLHVWKYYMFYLSQNFIKNLL